MPIYIKALSLTHCCFSVGINWDIWKSCLEQVALKGTCIYVNHNKRTWGDGEIRLSLNWYLVAGSTFESWQLGTTLQVNRLTLQEGIRRVQHLSPSLAEPPRPKGSGDVCARTPHPGHGVLCHFSSPTESKVALVGWCVSSTIAGMYGSFKLVYCCIKMLCTMTDVKTEEET